jgi:GT2 family glycosyltransferase
MHVAVVIVGFRNPEDVVGCLAALGRSHYRDFEVVVCENGGAESFAALSERAPETLAGGQSVQVLATGGNIGYAGGVNFGIAARPDAAAWWVLNPDTEPHPQALSAMVRRLARGDCEAVGSVLHSADNVVQAYGGGRWRPALARAVSLGMGCTLDAPIDAPSVEGAQSYVSGCSILLSRRFMELVGPMREDYFLYGEEIEWFLRARTRGVRLGLAPEARVLHHGGTTTGSHDRSSRQPKTPVYLDERNKILVTRDRFPALLPVVAPSSLALLVLRYGRRAAWKQLGYAVQGWAAGLMNRRGPPAWIDAPAASGAASTWGR